MVICSDSLKLLSCAHIANTRHGQQDVHHPKCELWDRHLPQPPGTMTGCSWVQVGGPGSHGKTFLILRALWGWQCPWVTRNQVTSQPSYLCHPWSHSSTVLLFLSWHFLCDCNSAGLWQIYGDIKASSTPQLSFFPLSMPSVLCASQAWFHIRSWPYKVTNWPWMMLS